jgi:hypothetical protein
MAPRPAGPFPIGVLRRFGGQLATLRPRQSLSAEKRKRRHFSWEPALKYGGIMAKLRPQQVALRESNAYTLR